MALDYSTFSVILGSTPSNGIAPYDGASLAQVNEIYAKIPRISDVKGQKYSTWRDVQQSELVGSGAHGGVGQGFASGGALAKTAAMVMSLEVDSIFFSGGVAARLTSALSYTEIVNGANYVWIQLRRTASPFNATDGNVMDSFAVRMERTATNVAPSITHIPVGLVTAAAGDITVWDDAPDGKYLCTESPIARKDFLSLAVTTADVTLRGQQAVRNVIQFTGALTGNRSVIFPLIPGMDWRVINATTGAFTLTCKGVTGTGFVVTQGNPATIFTNGTNFYGIM